MRAAFTLVELVVVMTIMVVTIAIVAPTFRGFMQGRNLTNEARRFLSATHFASTRAVNEGVPVDLMLDLQAGRYQMAASGGYSETRTNSVEFVLDKDVSMMASQASSALTQSNWWTIPVARGRGRLRMIRFQPDGFISDGSPPNVVFSQETATRGAPSQIWLVESADHRSYDIDADHKTVARF